MKITITLQREYRTLAILENDQGKQVAKFNLPRLVTLDELGTKSYKFREEHPELFPGEVKNE